MGMLRAIVVFLVKRILGAAAVLWIVAFLTYGVIRWLRPEQYPGQHYWPGLWHDISRAFFHWDWGPGCSPNPSCLGVQVYWERGWVSDVVLLGGGLLLAIGLGVTCGLWCARHQQTLRARCLEGLAMLAFCTPAYVLALGLLLAFSPDFGAFGLPYFFDANARNFDTIAHPLAWLRAYALPWTVLALPIAGAVTRMVVGMIREELGADHVRTAIAKGLPGRIVMRRHAAPGVYPSVAALIWGLVPIIVTNAMLIEYTLNVPGFFFRLKAASGKLEAPSGHHLPTVDIPMLSGIAMWTAACILVLTLLADLTVLVMDPRVRSPTV